MNKKLLALVLFSITFMPLSVITSQAAVAAGMSMGEAINKAGRQRMLSQRIAKAYFLKGQDLLFSQATNQLDDAIDLFQQQLSELEGFVATDEELKVHQKIVTLWKDYKKLVSATPTKANAPKVLEMSEKVLKNAHAFVGLLEKRSGSKAGYLVNLSGRQRMLTQRTSKFYVLRGWDMYDSTKRQEYNKAVSEFSNALRALMLSPSNTPEISKKLKSVSGKWQLFKLTKKTGDRKFVPSLVVRSLDGILVLMNDVTGMYAELPEVATVP